MKFKKLLLQNHWANFDQSCHNASLGELDSSLFKWKGPALFQGEIITKLAKIHYRNLKILVSRTTWPISTKIGTKHPWMKRIQVCFNEEPINSHRVNNVFDFPSLNQRHDIIICVYCLELFSQMSDVAHGPLVNLPIMEQYCKYAKWHCLSSHP